MASNTRSSRRVAVSAQPDMAALDSLERLILTQAVYELGANAWPAVAKLLTKHPLLSRHKSLFTPQTCHVIYNHLMKEADLECTEATYAPHAPLNLKLAQRHYQVRVHELRDLLLAEETKFKQIVSEIDEIRSGVWDNKITAKIRGTPTTQDVSSGATPPREKLADIDAPAEELFGSDLSGVTDSGSPRSPPREGSSKRSELMISPTTRRDAIQITNEDDRDERVPIARSSSDQATRLFPSDDRAKLDRLPVRGAASAHASAVTGARDYLHQTQDHGLVISSDYLLRASLQPTQFPGDRYRQAIVLNNAGESTLPLQQHGAQPLTPENTTENVNDADGQSPSPTAAASEGPTRRRENKRKASVTDGSEPGRDRKRMREELEAADEDDAGSSGLLSRRRDRQASGEHAASKKFQTVINLIHSQISQHRNGNIFHNPIKPSEAPDYYDIVKRPMDLKTIKTRVRDGLISNSAEFQRDVFLMFANAMMYNRPGSDIYNMAEDMMLESESQIHTYRTTEVTHRS